MVPGHPGAPVRTATRPATAPRRHRGVGGAGGGTGGGRSRRPHRGRPLVGRRRIAPPRLPWRAAHLWLGPREARRGGRDAGPGASAPAFGVVMTFARATHRRRPASHRTMVALCSGVVLVLAVAGCGPTSPPPGAPSTEAPPDGLVLAEMRYSCGDPPGFLPTILDEPATAETEDHPSAAALRAAIAQAGL